MSIRNHFNSFREAARDLARLRIPAQTSQDHSGLDLSADKQYLIESRLLPLSRKAGLSGISELVRKMKGGATSITTRVVEAMATNETFFFRDKVPFDHFRDSIMSEILQARGNRRSIRINPLQIAGSDR